MRSFAGNQNNSSGSKNTSENTIGAPETFSSEIPSGSSETGTRDSEIPIIRFGSVCYVERDSEIPVSYTHLTLPTKRIV